jgi:hypothetical protein
LPSEALAGHMARHALGNQKYLLTTP